MVRHCAYTIEGGKPATATAMRLKRCLTQRGNPEATKADTETARRKGSLASDPNKYLKPRLWSKSCMVKATLLEPKSGGVSWASCYDGTIRLAEVCIISHMSYDASRYFRPPLLKGLTDEMGT
jgi:hypothetical protein